MVWRLVLLEPPTNRISTRAAMGWLLFPLVWLIYTMVRGPMAAWYPYPLLNPANGGYATVAVTSAVIFIAGAVVCLLVLWLGTRRANLQADRLPT